MGRDFGLARDDYQRGRRAAPWQPNPPRRLPCAMPMTPEGSVLTLNLDPGTGTEEPVAAHDTRESRSFDEAFARLQADEPVTPEPSAPTIEPADTVEAASTDEAPPVFAGDEAAPAELPVPSVQPDTVTYGPQFLPEPPSPAAKPFYTRPVVYLGLGAALLILLVFSWNRTRTVPATPPADSPVSASAAEPAAPPPAPTQSGPAPVQQTPPAPAQSAPIEQVPTPQTPPKAETAAPAAPATAGTFAVQVGAYESAETAQALANSLGSRYGTKGVVDSVETGGKTLHRVRLLAASQADAKALAARVRRERAFDAIVVRLD
jgi:cell division septation protein DedD